jgi:tetratricopeptide (TPR) repeat protein
MPTDFARIQKVFQAVAGLPPAERAAVLERECGSDPDLRRCIDALLLAHDDPRELPAAEHELSGWPTTPPTPFPDCGELPEAEGEATGAYVPAVDANQLFAGRYKLREKLGQGGMGIVYVAEQLEPVQRRVALKIIGAGLDTRRLLARFEQERQALALMDHPNIAKVFDAGVDQAGRPYFAMELVKGLPLTKYCDDARLSTRERLELFIPVCQAVQHAHQKGIIHRDLKPSNILVGLYDGRAVPKVIDFGVAKATGPRLTEQSVYTEVGSIIGTLEYMSPEQAELNNLDIDTRSDIYALGVILYELLTGTVPFSRKELEKAGLAEMLRVIKEMEPAKPSTRLSGSGTLPSIAANRQTEPKALTALVRGELDWIVMKALEKNRQRRYETANAFAADIRHYLYDEAVLACPPSMTYRLRKFVRRNKVALATATLVATALLVGTTAAIWQAVRATQAETAVRGERDRALAAEEQARARLDESRRAQAKARERFQLARSAVDEFLTRVSESPEMKAHALEALRSKLLETAADFYEKFVREAAGDLEVRAERGRGYNRLGELYGRTGRSDRAEKAYHEAIAIQRQLSEAAPGEPTYAQDLGKSLYKLGELYFNVARHSQSEKSYQETMAIQRKLAKTYADVPDYQNDLAQTLINVGALYTYRDMDLALNAWQEALAIQKPLAAAHPKNAAFLHVLGDIYLNLGYGKSIANRPGLGESDNKQAVATLRAVVQIDPDNPDYQDDLAGALNNLATTYRKTKRVELAQGAFAEAIAIKKKLAELHPQVPGYLSTLAGIQNNLGRLLNETGHTPEAETVVKEAMGTIDRFAIAHPEMMEDYITPRILIHNRLGALYRQTNRIVQAEATWKEVMTFHHELADKSLSALDGSRLNDTCTPLTDLYRQASRIKDAELVWKDAVDLMKRKCAVPPKSDDALSWLADFQMKLAQQYQDLGQKDLAIETLKDAASVVEAWTRAQTSSRKELILGNLELSRWLANLSEKLLEQKAFADAEPLLRECWARRSQSAPGAWKTFNAQSMLGGALLGQKKFAEAEPFLVDGYQGMKKTEKTVPPGARIYITQAAGRLVEFYQATGKAIALEPDYVKELHRDSASYYIGLSQWDKAAAEYAQADWSRPLDDEAFACACLFLIRGDSKGYNRFCEGMIERVKQTPAPFEAYVLARSCAMAAQCPVDPARAVQWANQAIASGQKPWYVHVLGLAQYRAGQFDPALQSFKKADVQGWTNRDLNWFGLALVHHRLGHGEEAQQCLAKGIQWLKQEGPQDTERPANLLPRDWLEAQLLRHESEELLKTKRSP